MSGKIGDYSLFRQADTDNNGVIDKEEFRQLWGAVRCSGGGEVSVRNKMDPLSNTKEFVEVCLNYPYHIYLLC